MADDLQQLSDWLVPLISKLQPSQRLRLASEVAKEVRKVNQANMAAQQGPDGSAWEPRKNRMRDARGRLRQGKMFPKLRTARHLKAKGFQNEAVVQFVGRAARLAAIHHRGLRDRVSPGGAEYKYPARELLGISDRTIEALRDMVLDHLST